MPNWLGDAVMATPIIEDIRNHFLGAQISVLCHEAIATLLSSNPHIDEFLTFSKENKRKSVEKARILHTLREKKFDLGILLTRSFSSAWWFFRGHVRFRLGFRDHFRSFLLNMPLALPEHEESQHQVLTYKLLLEPLGIPVSNTLPSLYLQKEELEQAQELLQKYKVKPDATLIGINPGASYGSAKCWLSERFVALTEKLLKDPKIHIIYFGDSASKPLVDKICSGFPSRVLNLATKTDLCQLIALIKLCHSFITNDSGPMHIAAALKTPLVAIFGSTSEIKTGPYGHGKIIHKHVSCSPCYRRTCPIDFRCMTTITEDEVYHEVLSTLRQSQKNIQLH